MLDVEVIDDPAIAQSALDPLRSRILAALREPGSATTVAATLDLPRQKVNYHLRDLETHGLVELMEERPRRGLTERIMAASARSYAVSPSALGASGADPIGTDRHSRRYLIAIAARLLREVAELAHRADEAGQSLATLSIDSEIRFASAADRSAFTSELAESIAELTARYHDESAPRGRWHRLLVAAHPRPAPPARDQRQSPSAPENHEGTTTHV